MNNLRITVSSKSGCGNSTVSGMLARKLGLKLINYTFHDLAEEKKMDFEELCLLAENDDQYDLFVDKRQLELAACRKCIIASRLAIWLLKNADLKVYLEASPQVRAGRIARRESLSIDEASTAMAERDMRDHQRYLRLYGIDIDIYDFVDLVVDTEMGDQFYVVDQIIKKVKNI
ncbi:MAG: cytidylate kinase [Spirochaeta sp.]|nr:cytidylate kinase [Spirochaeta sp.]